MVAFSHLPDRAISIRQPWAFAVVHCGKDIENRSQRFKFRGPVCIHSGVGMVDRTDYNPFADLVKAQFPDQCWQWIAKFCNGGDQRGGIIGTADLTDVVEHSQSPWFVGPVDLVLKNVKPVPFIAVRGQLGIFHWKTRLKSERVPA